MFHFKHLPARTITENGYMYKFLQFDTLLLEERDRENWRYLTVTSDLLPRHEYAAVRNSSVLLDISLECIH